MKASCEETRHLLWRPYCSRPIKGHCRDNVPCWTAVLLGAIAFSSGPALAQPRVPPAKAPRVATQTAEQPWSVGVTAADRIRAQGLLARGNGLLIQNQYAAALELYERAARAWNHPAIHANMVICFINLGRTVEAYESARIALSYGAAPFDKPEVHAATITFMRLLETQVGFVEVRCKRGVKVTLDGQPLRECPIARRSVLAGRHQLVAQKRGFLTVSRDLVTIAGNTEAVKLPLIPLRDVTRMDRRWRSAMPMLLVGSGAAILTAGFLVGWSTGNDNGGGGGGDDDPERPNRIAITSMSAGAALTVAGLALLYINRPRPAPASGSRRIQVLPTLAPSSAGISLGITF
jgi:hypothetical protein